MAIKFAFEHRTKMVNRRYRTCSALTNMGHLILIGVLGVILQQGSFVDGLNDIYSNSHISPKSDHVAADIDENISTTDFKGISTILTSEKLLPESSEIHKTSIYQSEPDKQHIIVERSASPILIGDEHSYKFKLDNDVLDSDVIVHRDYFSPTKSIQANILANSGEVWRAPRGNKALPLQEPTIPISTTVKRDVMEMTTPNIVSETPRGRQSNPDIQDIITGIVKLLNGNVNVQANTPPPPPPPRQQHRPTSTRINNRGPPRISDLPSDYEDTPSTNVLPPPPTQTPPPTKIPPPYPFDRPQLNGPVRPFLNGVPVPEQIVPLGPHRPRPPQISRLPPPWHRRPPRPPQRYPPSIPAYKPLPPLDLDTDVGDEVSLTSIEPANQDMSVGEHGLASDDINIGQTEATYHDLGDQLMFHEVTDLKESENHSEPALSTSSNPADLINEEFVKEPYNEKKPINNKEKEKPSSTKIEKSTTESSSATITTEIKPTQIAPTEATRTEITISTIESTNRDPVILHEEEIEGVGEAIPVLETSMKDIESMVAKIDITTPESDVHSKSTPVLPTVTSSSETTSTDLTSPSPSSVTSTTESVINTQPTVSSDFPYYPYRPRPGIVLDDTDYKPGRRPPIVTARPPQIGEIFDVTVSAIQGPGGSSGQSSPGKPYVIPIDIDGIQIAPTNADVITSPSGSEGFVSIDGKRTYLNLFGDATPQPHSTTSRIASNVVKPTKTVTENTVQVTGTGYAVPHNDAPAVPTRPTGVVKPTVPRRPVKRPQPTVRIDTCIVGDDSTCDAGQQEMCRTDMGVSSCHCRPGHSRRKHREPCRRVVSILMSLRVDKMYERRIVWDPKLASKETDEYLQLSYEATRAVDSAMSMTPFSDDFIEGKVNNIYKGDPATGTAGVFVNMTLMLEEDAETVRPQVKGDIQRHLLGAIQRRSNNIGNSALWVDAPAGSVSGLHDFDECSSPEYNDCHPEAICTNVFGGFTCTCKPGLRDPWADNRARAGRKCETCPSSYCNNRGFCKYDKGQQVCSCQGNYYGSQCEIDGEVVTVAVCASLAAIIIIGLTLVCLVMWSRKWNREQKAAAAAVGGMGGLGSPVFGYMAAGTGGTVKTPVVGPPPYQLTLEDRMRWAHLADVMAQANHYAQPEPVGAGVTRPSSAVFGGYPTLSMHGTLAPPVPLPRLGLHMTNAAQQRAASIHGMNMRGNNTQQHSVDNTSSSEEEDRTDLLGRNFQVPRPKSRSSVANQSGIYYDVDYDQGEMYKHTQGGGIPMSTYTPGRPPYFRN